LTSLATALVQVGQVDTAQVMLQEAQQAAQDITEEWPRDEALAAIATALAQKGNSDRAQQVALGITEEWRRAEALAAIATTLAQRGQMNAAQVMLQKAQQVAQDIEYKGHRDWALAAITTTLTKWGYVAAAQQMAQEITEQWQRAEALAAIATALAQRGQMDTAQVVLQEAQRHLNLLDFPVDYREVRVLDAVTTALLKSGAHQQLLALVQYAWCTTTTRDTLVKFLPKTAPLIPYAPFMSMALTQGFTWVDDFLKQA
jgi:tetratricopeptide (TPR) repeat protein